LKVQIQLDFEEGSGEGSWPLLEQLLASLPPLPSVIRYYDDFDDVVRSITGPSQAPVFDIYRYGTLNRLNFDRYPPLFAAVQKQILVFLLGEDLHISSCFFTLSAASCILTADVEQVLAVGPAGITSTWAELRARKWPIGAYGFLKSLMRLLCKYRELGWSPSYLDLVNRSLPLPAGEEYAGVRSGDVFLSVDEEAAIVRYIDEAAVKLKSLDGPGLRLEELRDAAMVLCAFQFAMRPIQIAMLAKRDVRIWEESPGASPSVHLTFLMVKQKSERRGRPMVRRVKLEWAGLFVELMRRHDSKSAHGSDRFFNVNSSRQVGKRIADRVEHLIGADACATDLRHTAAQRLVDAGANHEELAEFMGHSSVQTGLVYYATSASHAERVNRALGASEVYRRVAKIAHDRFISLEDLADLKDEQQIAGVPHGIPIAGIGGCTSGQPACPSNPVASCYGCMKFMPLRDKATHENVLGSMREVVLFFEQSSRGDVRSPTYLQLSHTITAIQNVISELDGDAV
jgi:integrase